MNSSEIINALMGIASIIIPILTGRYESDRKEKLNGFILFLEGLSSSLREMVIELRQGRVPTAAGNKLEKDLNDFESYYMMFDLNGETLRRFVEAHESLKRNLLDGKFLDEAIRGVILFNSESEKTLLLEKMGRTSAEISNLAGKLRLK